MINKIGSDSSAGLIMGDLLLHFYWGSLHSYDHKLKQIGPDATPINDIIKMVRINEYLVLCAE